LNQGYAEFTDSEQQVGQLTSYAQIFNCDKCEVPRQEPVRD